jgi:predicted HTH transcriptional regulator
VPTLDVHGGCPCNRRPESDGNAAGVHSASHSCSGGGLPALAFSEVAGGFNVTLFGDPYPPERLEALGLNERQRAAVAYLKEGGRISSADYQRLTGAPRTTVVRDFGGLVEAGVVERRGSGRGTHYVLRASVG